MTNPSCGTCRHWQPLDPPSYYTGVQQGYCEKVIKDNPTLPFWLVLPLRQITTLATEGQYCLTWQMQKRRIRLELAA